MSQQTQFVECWAHKRLFPRAACNPHHEVPRAAGGGDGGDNITYLCTNCHSIVHRAAEKLRIGKTGHASDIVSAYAPNVPIFRQRLMELARIVAESMQQTEEGELVGKDEIMVMVPLPRDIHKRFKLLVGDLRHEGRRMGMARFVRLLIDRELKRKGLL